MGRLLANVTSTGLLFGLKRSDFVQNANANGSFARGYDGMDGVPCGDQSSNLRVKVEMDFDHSTARFPKHLFFFQAVLPRRNIDPIIAPAPKQMMAMQSTMVESNP